MSFVQNNWMLILVFVASGAMLLWPLIQRQFMSSAKELGTAEATRLINDRNPVVLDIRETRELDAGKLPNAIHIPLSQLSSRSQEIAGFTSRPVLAYCARGNRSASAAGRLTKLGFKEVYGLRGGINAWRAAGLPVVK